MTCRAVSSKDKQPIFLRNKETIIMDKVHRHFIFHGCVQGVGFRYTACYTARNYGVSSWVRIDEGSVDRIKSKDFLLHEIMDLR